MFMKYSIVTRIYTEILINQAVDNFTSSRFRESRMNEEEKENAAKEDRKPIIMEHINLHACRHSFATRCLEAGIAPKIVQTWLVQHCRNNGEYSTRYFRHRRVVVSQRCTGIASFLRLALTKIACTVFTVISAPLY